MPTVGSDHRVHENVGHATPFKAEAPQATTQHRDSDFSRRHYAKIMTQPRAQPSSELTDGTNAGALPDNSQDGHDQFEWSCKEASAAAFTDLEHELTRL